MSAAFCAAMMQAVLLSAPSAPDDSYASAQRQTEQTGRPLVVMVGADWCAPCQNMKRSILPKVRAHGLLRRVAFAQVNVDRDQKLAQELTGGGPVPQLVMYRKTRTGWVRRKLVGGQSVATVEKFINEGLALNAAEQLDEAEEHSGDPAAEFDPADAG